MTAQSRTDEALMSGGNIPIVCSLAETTYNLLNCEELNSLLSH